MHGTSLLRTSYQVLLKPLLFKFDAELVHDHFTAAGVALSKQAVAKQLAQWALNYEHPMLTQEISGITFSNPVGLSAGFDYNGKLPGILGSVGFGFMSAGTVTNRSYEGNVKPRLGRLPKSKALLVNKGFKSIGIDAFLKELVVSPDIRLGVSIGATNAKDTSTSATQIRDIIAGVKKVLAHPKHAHISYLEINISCPNVIGSGSLANPKSLTTLLKQINRLKPPCPLFVKFPIEISWADADPLVKIMIEHGVAGVIIGNLLKNRQSSTVNQAEVKTIQHLKGNISGKPTNKYSNQLIAKTYRAYGKEIIIIGVGGIFSAQDAYEKIKLGASLVQLITGMIYEGPQLIGEINRDLVTLLKQDGYDHLSQAIGAYHT